MRLSSNPILLAVCGFAAIVLLSSAAHAQNRPGAAGAQGQKPDMRNNPPFPFGLAEGRLMTELAEDLGLSGKTLSAIKALTETQRAEEAKISKESTTAWQKLNSLLNEGLPSEDALMHASRELGDVVAKMRNLKLTYTRNVRALLPAEQLESYMVRRKYVPVPRAGGQAPGGRGRGGLIQPGKRGGDRP